jgi:hypothetical protein
MISVKLIHRRQSAAAAPPLGKARFRQEPVLSEGAESYTVNLRLRLPEAAFYLKLKRVLVCNLCTDKGGRVHSP